MLRCATKGPYTWYMIGNALFWAAIVIGAAVVFRGTPQSDAVKDWIGVGFILTHSVLVLQNARCAPCRKPVPIEADRQPPVR